MAWNELDWIAAPNRINCNFGHTITTRKDDSSGFLAIPRERTKVAQAANSALPMTTPPISRSKKSGW